MNKNGTQEDGEKYEHYLKQLLGTGYKYSFATDIYAFGITLLETVLQWHCYKDEES